MTDRTLPTGAHMIPEAAECVFTGQIFQVFQWPQRLYDGSVATFEMLRRSDTVAVFALDADNRLVTLDECQPGGVVRHGNVPVGRVEPTDASVLDGAKREMREETGMEFAHWRLLGVRQPEAKIEWFIHAFAACDLIGESQQQLDAGEQIEVGRSPFDQVKASRYSWPLEGAASAADLRASILALQ